MKILDSTFVIDLLRGEPKAVKKIRQLENEKLASTRINAFEVFIGELRRSGNYTKAREIFKTFQILELNEDSTAKAAKIQAEFLRNGISVNTEDILIAGIMLANGCKTIVTNDSDFEKIPGIEVEKY